MVNRKQLDINTAHTTLFGTSRAMKLCYSRKNIVTTVLPPRTFISLEKTAPVSNFLLCFTTVAAGIYIRLCYRNTRHWMSNEGRAECVCEMMALFRKLYINNVIKIKYWRGSDEGENSW